MLLSHLNFDRPANVEITFRRYSTILTNINNLTKGTEIPLSDAFTMYVKLTIQNTKKSGMLMMVQA